MENTKDCGEDSYFILPEYQDLVSPGSNYIFMAVFDGVGGEKGGKEASEKAKEITQSWCQHILDQQKQCQLNRENLTELKTQIEEALKKLSHESTPKKSRLRGSLAKRSFSTTIALAAISELENNIQVELAWIGDSRIYFLNSKKGLQQLTLDDLKERQDGFKSKSGMPLSKTLSANMDPDWGFNFKRIKLPQNGFIITCTDGVFEDIKPWELEYLILDNLDKASSKDDWESLLKQYYQNHKTDDVTFILLPVGFDCYSSEGFSKIKENFKNRNKNLMELLNLPTDQSSSDDLIWEKYSQNYENILKKYQDKKENDPQNNPQSIKNPQPTEPSEPRDELLGSYPPIQNNKKLWLLLFFRNKTIEIAIFTIFTIIIIAWLSGLTIDSDDLNIEGNNWLSDQSIIETVSLNAPQSIWTIQPREIETNLVQGPWIDSAVVNRQIFPPGLTIKVRERFPIAIIKLDSKEINRNVVGFLDSEGKLREIEKLPTTLKFITDHHQYRDNWKSMYQALMNHQEVEISKIDWRNPNDIILNTGIGKVHIGEYKKSRFPEQLQVLKKMKDKGVIEENKNFIINLTDLNIEEAEKNGYNNLIQKGENYNNKFESHTFL